MKTHIKSYKFKPSHRVGILLGNAFAWTLILALVFGEVTRIEFAVAFFAVAVLGNVIRQTAATESKKQ